MSFKFQLPSLFLLLISIGNPGTLLAQNPSQTSARQALSLLEHHAGPVEVANVVAIVGDNGQDQPKAWRILVRDVQADQILREYTITSGQVLGPKQIVRTPNADLPSVPILLASMRIDSTDAFHIADDTAISNGISFDRIGYQLRWRGNDPEPTWMATLVDSKGVQTGRIYIMAVSGKVVHKEVVSQQRPAPRQTPQQPQLTPVRGMPQPQPNPNVRQPLPQPQQPRNVRPAPATPQPEPNIWLQNPALPRRYAPQQQPAAPIYRRGT